MGNSISTVSEDDYEIRKFSHFPPNDTREWLKYFKENYECGFMTVSDFEDIFREYFPFYQYSNEIQLLEKDNTNCKEENEIINKEEEKFTLNQPNFVRKFSKQLFDTINIGQTGTIDFNELLIAFSILTKGSSFEKVRWLFRFYDYDRDGVVSKTELLDCVDNFIKMTSPLFNENDDLSENNLSFSVKNNFAKEIVENIFKSLENESGFLTFNDFETLSVLHKEEFNSISFFTG